MATYNGLAVPLVGNSDIVGNVTITGTVGITGATTVTGALAATGKVSGSKAALTILTTKPTTGLTKGEIFLLFHGSTPKIGVCTSTAADTIKMIRLKTKTLGRLTA